MSVPFTSTYRFQLHKDFTFADAERVLPYLKKLGVSHAYCSPILTAVPGSVHGYDVIDHTRVNPELGGRWAFESFAAAAHDLGLGVVVDVVPNHMAFVAPESANEPLWSLLKGGQHGPSAHWFDVDWAAGDGKLDIAILGEPLDKCIESGDIKLEWHEGEPRITYFDHVFPVASGTETGVSEGQAGDPNTVRRVLEKQHYRLHFWRDRDKALNYRRFFEVSELIAIRVEERDVFDASHALLLELHHAGLIDGFRIDHPDGLADPERYLQWLSEECRKGTPIWVEKILEPGEHLPQSWNCSGTTGYDAMAAITRTLVDPASAETLGQTWRNAMAIGDPETLDQATSEAKRFVVLNNLVPEVERLTRRAHEALGEFSQERLRDAVVELLVAAPVYRAYLRPGEKMADESAHYLDEAVASATHARPELRAEIEELGTLARFEDAKTAKASRRSRDRDDDAAERSEAPVDRAAAARRDFAIRLQQTWGPVMAKSVEDTLFYRWFELSAMNEVGGSPEDIAEASAESLHEWAVHNAKRWPRTMTTLSTHDTKRSEDVRAAILAIAGDPESWQKCSEAAFALADVVGLDRAAGALVWQTIAGFATSAGDAGYQDDGQRLDVDTERLRDYLTKALREAKLFTAWIDGDESYEKRAFAMADAVVANEPTGGDAKRNEAGAHGEAAASADPKAVLGAALRGAILEARRRNKDAIRLTGFSQKALELFLPGIPDTYQGSERPTLSLVDPDNRRPVDYDELQALLATPGSRPRFVQQCLAPEVHRPASPGAAYERLDSDSEFVVAFVRSRNAGFLAQLTEAGRQVSRFISRDPEPKSGDKKAAENQGQNNDLDAASAPHDQSATEPLAVAVVGIRAASRALREGNLDKARLQLPAGTWRHAFTGERFTVAGGGVTLGEFGSHDYSHVHVLVREK